jgi:hypothetical protein
LDPTLKNDDALCSRKLDCCGRRPRLRDTMAIAALVFSWALFGYVLGVTNANGQVEDVIVPERDPSGDLPNHLRSERQLGVIICSATRSVLPGCLRQDLADTE